MHVARLAFEARNMFLERVDLEVTTGGNEYVRRLTSAIGLSRGGYVGH